MTTAQAASSATLSVASVPKKAVVVPQRVAHQEVEVQEVVPRTAVPPEAVTRHQENRTAVAVVPAVTRMIITHRAAVAEAEGGSFCHKTDKTNKTLFQHIGRATAPNRDAVAYPD